MSRKQWTDEEDAMLIKCRKEGDSIKVIARKTGIDEKRIHRRIALLKEKGFDVRKKRNVNVTEDLKFKERMHPIFCEFTEEIHTNHYEPWTTTEIKYVVDNYGKIPLTEMSLALGRTYRTVQRRIYELKENGTIKR